ncbi:hypothetical protein Q4583_16280 [Neptunomonas phycophila]|jgi:hypothetical protein|uniref:Uncharacterized protein n=1 Tax=Neptunomonas phycophila TaxID=1572645 RepID=A0AAW7XLV5_9GAMM|nr:MULTISPECIES: hypothetical protein [Neptunomonas]MBT3147184.1 hypothetical protein [Neptunomonas phycophila]MDN2660331.1 hypothetical protein [Neptunomonas sp. CHC150]MDO6453893.1 hypothetical protein [Neptunomonas phycophila]MDO6469426.1 hypothetical protein [Neptunomonas phycophila]MDO6785672.1 hypothetical protein [Neptunomonas phycophila]
MDRKLSSNDKFNLQQNFRRYLKFQDQYEEANEAAKTARASRVWIAALIALLFALASDFFMGASAALFGLYFYRVMSASMKVGSAQEGREDTERWFASKGLRFEGRVLYFRDDQMLDTPLDPFDDALYQ